MTSFFRTARRLAVAFLVAGAAAAPARAQEPYYKGKRLTVLINFAVSGPTDIEGRLFAKYLARHVDGNPTIIVQNMDGAGGLVGAQYMGEIAPRDGSVVGYLTGVAWMYASDPARWRVDFRTYEFLAASSGTTIHYARTDIAPGLHEAADIAKAQGVIAGGLSADTSKDLRLRLALDMLGVPFKYVTGYRSSPPARLALQRGEINMFTESPPSYRSLVEPTMVRSGEVMPIFYDEDDVSDHPPKSRQLEGLSIQPFPQLYKRIKGALPSGKFWDAYRAIYDMNATLLRVVVLPPGIPPAAVEALRKGIEGLANDKEFAVEAMGAIEFVPEYSTAADLNTHVREMLVVAPEMRDFINDYMRNPPKQ